MTLPAPSEPRRIIRWSCETCGWTCDVPMPGFAGSMLSGEHAHWQGEVACGPLVGRLLLAEADPGATSEEVARAVTEAGYVAS